MRRALFSGSYFEVPKENDWGRLELELELEVGVSCLLPLKVFCMKRALSIALICIIKF